MNICKSDMLELICRWVALSLFVLCLVAAKNVFPRQVSAAWPDVVHFCDSAKRDVFRFDRSGLLSILGTDQDTVLVATGGALTSCLEAGKQRLACAVEMLDLFPFDVVNIAHRDLVGDAQEVAEVVKSSRTTFVSASFRLPAEVSTPWEDFVIVERGERRIAFVGIAKPSPSMSLAGSGVIKGLRYAEPEEALRRVLTKISNAEAIVVLADASLPAVADWLDKFEQIDAAIVSGRGGVSPTNEVAERIFLSPPGGTTLGVLRYSRLGFENRVAVLPEPPEVSQAYQRMSKRFFPMPKASAVTPEEPMRTYVPATIEPGQSLPLGSGGQNRAVALTARSVSVLDRFGMEKAPNGRGFLVIDTSWQNVLSPAIVRDRQVPVVYRIKTLSDHLYCVMDRRVILPQVQPQDVVGILPNELKLPHPGSAIRGRLIYDIPFDVQRKELTLRYYDYAHGHIFIPLLGRPVEEMKPLTDLEQNEVIEAGVYGFNRNKALDGHIAPEGMTFITVDLRARSLYTFSSDATAFDPKAKPGDKIKIGTVSDWKESRVYMQLVADGEYAYQAHPLTALPEEPRLLPDLMTGGPVVFLGPEKASWLELRCDFPHAELPDRGEIQPKPITFLLEGKRSPLPERKAMVRIDDDVFKVAIGGLRYQRTFAAGEADEYSKFLVLDVTVENMGSKGEFFQTIEQLHYLSETGEEQEIDEITFEGIRRPAELAWIPPGERRAFQVVYRVPDTETRPRLSFRGFTLAKVLSLEPEGEKLAEAIKEEAAEPQGEAVPELTEAGGPKASGPLVESEPNDKLEQANTLMLDGDVEGLIQAKEDEDWYKLVVGEGGRSIVRIALSGVPDVNSHLSLYDREGNEIKEINVAQDGEPESVANWGVTKGTYYIRVYQWSGINKTDKYLLTAQLVGPWQEGQEYEPNDEQDSANKLAANGHIEGFLEPNDADWYRVDVTIPGKSILRLDLTGGLEVDKELAIYDANGEELWEADAFTEDEPEAIINFGVTKGQYYVQVRGRGALPGKPQEYTLRSGLSPWKEGQEVEPNNDIESGSVVNVNQTAVGYLYPEEDQDWFVLDVPESGLDILTIGLSGTPDVNAWLILRDADGNEIKKVDHTEESGEEQIVQLKVMPGKYYIGAVSYEGKNPESAYQLWVGEPREPPATDDEVREALAKALDFLAGQQTEGGCWPSSRHEKSAGIAGLALMAFVGAESLDKDYSHNIEAAIEFLKTKYHPSSKHKPGSKEAVSKGGLIGHDDPMYEHAIATLGLIETLVYRKNLALKPIIEDAIALTIRTQNTEHKPQALGGPIREDSDHHGGWRYNTDSTDSDIGVTGWHVLALKAALNVHLSIPEWSLAKAADYVRRCYHAKEEPVFWYQTTAAGGWPNLGIGSCCQTAIGALVLQLTGYPNDKYVLPALRFMQQNPPQWLIEDPGEGFPFYYWYYGTRTMLISGGDDWRIWTDWTCRLLVDNQNADGSWDVAQREKYVGEAYTTALGALMLELCLGHIPVYILEEPVTLPEQAKGPGYVQILFEKGAEKETEKNVELILDASNSMWGQIKGESKISIARKVLKQIIRGLPEKMNVGLRVYGHRYKLKDERACWDTELMVPIGPIAKDQMIDHIEKIKPRGKTPLVHSVLQGVKDFEDIAKGSIILISDGIESCGGDIHGIAPALKETGLDLRVHIVGFGIKEAKARKELEAIAGSTGGKYLDAKDSQELLSSLEETLQIEYAIIDKKGDVKIEGFVGGKSVEVRGGTYLLRLMLEPEPVEEKLIIEPEEKMVLYLKKEEGEWVIKE